MFDRFTERHLLKILPRSLIKLSDVESGILLCIYIESKTLRILESNSNAFDNPFAYRYSAEEENKRFLCLARQYQRNSKTFERTSGFSSSPYPELVYNLLRCLTGIIYAPELVTNLRAIYDKLFISYVDRLKSLAYLDEISKQCMIKDETPWLTPFINNCMIYDPVYPSFLIEKYEEDIELQKKLLSYRSLLSDIQHNPTNIIRNAINAWAGTIRQYHSDCTLEKMVEIEPIIRALESCQQQQERLTGTLYKYKKNLAYSIWENLHMFLNFVNQADYNTIHHKDVNYEMEAYSDFPLWIAARDYRDEIKILLPAKLYK